MTSGDWVNEVRRLENFCRQLDMAIDEIEHELRRCADELERHGQTPSLHQRLSELQRNLELNRRERDEAIRAIDRIDRARTAK